jgi:hypothetical protein
MIYRDCGVVVIHLLVYKTDICLIVAYRIITQLNIFLLRITGFFELLPSYGITETRKHDVSETGYVSVLRGGGRHLLSWVP